MKTYTLILHYEDGIEMFSCKRMNISEAWELFRNHLWGEIKKVEIEID